MVCSACTCVIISINFCPQSLCEDTSGEVTWNKHKVQNNSGVEKWKEEKIKEELNLCRSCQMAAYLSNQVKQDVFRTILFNLII